MANSLPLLLSRATILADVPRRYEFLQNRARQLFQPWLGFTGAADSHKAGAWSGGGLQPDPRP